MHLAAVVGVGRVRTAAPAKCARLAAISSGRDGARGEDGYGDASGTERPGPGSRREVGGGGQHFGGGSCLGTIVLLSPLRQAQRAASDLGPNGQLRARDEAVEQQAGAELPGGPRASLECARRPKTSDKKRCLRGGVALTGVADRGRGTRQRKATMASKPMAGREPGAGDKLSPTHRLARLAQRQPRRGAGPEGEDQRQQQQRPGQKSSTPAKCWTQSLEGAFGRPLASLSETRAGNQRPWPPHSRLRSHGLVGSRPTLRETREGSHWRWRAGHAG